MENEDKAECPECGNRYIKIGSHWGANPNHRPDLTQKQKQIAVGWMLGDGCILDHSRNVALQLSNTKREFLEWTKEQFGVLASNGITVADTPEEKAQEARERYGVEKTPEHYPPTYNLHISSHPHFNQFREWYGGDGMELPEQVELGRVSLRVWYACDGNLDTAQKTPTPRFSLGKERKNHKRVSGWFGKFGLSPNYSYPYLYICDSEKSQFADVIGDPLPGYGYKWQFGEVRADG